MKNLFASFKNDGTDYLAERKEVVRLQAIRKGASIGSTFAGVIMVAVFSVFFLVFAGIGLALWIGDSLHNNWAGFLIVGGIFLLLIFIVFYCISSSILENIIIRKAMNGKMKNRTDLDREIESGNERVKQKEYAFRQKISDPFTYIGSVSVLRFLYKLIRKKFNI